MENPGWFSPVWRGFQILGGAVFAAGLACAQFMSSVEGTVTDATQAGIPGAVVVLIDESTQVTQRAKTSETGFFRIPQLPPGTYRLEVGSGSRCVLNADS